MERNNFVLHFIANVRHYCNFISISLQDIFLAWKEIWMGENIKVTD